MIVWGFLGDFKDFWRLFGDFVSSLELIYIFFSFFQALTRVVGPC